jgi:hypothetical protein
MIAGVLRQSFFSTYKQIEQYIYVEKLKGPNQSLLFTMRTATLI